MTAATGEKGAQVKTFPYHLFTIDCENTSKWLIFIDAKNDDLERTNRYWFLSYDETTDQWFGKRQHTGRKNKAGQVYLPRKMTEHLLMWAFMQGCR